MVGDKPRTEAYRAAIQASRHLFQDKVVLDIGAGTDSCEDHSVGSCGVRWASAASAPYAIDRPQTRAGRLTRQPEGGTGPVGRHPQRGPNRRTLNAERNGFGDVVRVVHGRIEDVTLPEQADVIVSEWMGFYLLHESMLDSVIVGRDRFLAPDGVMFPDVARLYACPSTLAAFHCDQLQCWSRPYGLDLTAVGEAARRSMQQAPQVLDTHPEELLAAPELVLELHLQYVTAEELAAVTCRRFVTVTRPGPYRGLCLWFECQFPDGSRLDTAPRAPSTHWRQTAVVLPTDYPLEVDTVIGWELTLAREADGGRKYRIALSMLDEDDEHPVPCGCAVGKCRLIKALIDKEDAECDEG
ncbi:putative protein arginine N-methyltransferase 6 [Amphibalanus amphitrite]|uniref:Protein arginine N-methyltransferase domain-containing protein n=1 Tax=Amphibalanus amphitrite TaxID=1232801 RepID=A0A6A4WS85_AMPAM|nr:putative protein arginine N-methyltransferase 6 [Amphibalanus amphitrite]